MNRECVRLSGGDRKRKVRIPSCVVNCVRSMEPQNAISAGDLLYTSSTKKRPLLLTIESDWEAEEPPMKKIKLEKEPEVKVEKEPEVKEDAILSLGFDALVRPDEELDKKELEIKRQRELVQQRKQQLRERIDAFFGKK